MSSTFTLRRATPADEQAIVAANAAMAAETEGMTLDRDRLALGVRALLADPARGFYLIAETEGAAPADAPFGRVAAQLMITPEWSDWRNAFFWWIQSVHVWPPFRRQGAYRALHRHAERLAREEGACGLRLYVERTNAAAQATYLALGMGLSHYDLFETDFTR